MSPDASAPRPRWRLLDQLFGGWSPDVAPELAAWERPHTFPLVGWGALLAVWALVLSNLIYVLGAQTGAELVLGAKQSTTLVLSPLVMAAAFGVYVVRWRQRGGWVTVDPAGRLLTVRRQFQREQLASWSFDDITRVRVRGGHLRIDLRDATLLVRVYPTLSRGLAASLRHAVGGANLGR